MPRPVCAFDPAGSTVITVGSASKAFWAGMRIGWVRAAPDVIRSLVAARAYADLGTPVLEQLAVNWLMSTGGWAQAVGIRREQARGNRDALVAAVRRELPDWEFSEPRGGLTLWVRTGGLSGSRLAEVGERVGVRVPSGPRFGVDGAFEGYVRLPFTVGERSPRRRPRGWPRPRGWCGTGRRAGARGRGRSWRETRPGCAHLPALGFARAGGAPVAPSGTAVRGRAGSLRSRPPRLSRASPVGSCVAGGGPGPPGGVVRACSRRRGPGWWGPGGGGWERGPDGRSRDPGDVRGGGGGGCRAQDRFHLLGGGGAQDHARAGVPAYRVREGVQVVELFGDHDGDVDRPAVAQGDLEE